MIFSSSTDEEKATKPLDLTSELFSITVWEKIAKNLVFCYVAGCDYA